MKLSQLQNACWKWLSPYCYETKTCYQLSQIEASVEPVTKLCQIPMEMFLADGMKGSPQRVLYVADDGIDPLELRDLDAGRAAAGDDYRVVIPGSAEGLEAAQAIGNNLGTRSQMVGSPCINSF